MAMLGKAGDEVGKASLELAIGNRTCEEEGLHEMGGGEGTAGGEGRRWRVAMEHTTDPRKFPLFFRLRFAGPPTTSWSRSPQSFFFFLNFLQKLWLLNIN